MDPKRLHWIFNRFMKPADDGEGGGAGGGAVDRGDGFITSEKSPKDVVNDASGDSDDADVDDKGAAKGGKAEKDDESDDDGDDDGEEGEGDEPKGKKKGAPRIPLSRHEAILNKEREKRQEMERQLAQFQKGQQVAVTNEELTKLEDKIIGLERDYNVAMADGETEKATQLMRQIRVLDRQVTETRSEMRTAVAEARAVEQVRYSTALERIEESFPQLNEDAEDYDPELAQDVVDLKATYERRGMTPTQALQKAVKKLVDVDTGAQKSATEVAPRVTADQVAAQRKKDAVAKTAGAAKRTPPSTGKVGQDSDRNGGSLRGEDVIKMSQDDFARLDDTELKRLRGDDF
jgi:hypothetical protein